MVVIYIKYIDKVYYKQSQLLLPQITSLLGSHSNILLYLTNKLLEHDMIFKDVFLIENKNSNLTIKSVPFRVMDNTLFIFLKSIFLPFCKNLYNKKYSLVKNVGFSLAEIDSLTYIESQIYLNLYNEEEYKKLKNAK